LTGNYGDGPIRAQANYNSVESQAEVRKITRSHEFIDGVKINPVGRPGWVRLFKTAVGGRSRFLAGADRFLWW